jgi:glycosyltransferase involved in cell wall biosynthesis
VKIGFDCSHHLFPGGIRAYIENILGAIVRAEPENEYILYYRSRRRPRVFVPLPAGARSRMVFAAGPRRLYTFLENRLGVPAVERWTGPIDVFHGTHFTLPVTRSARPILTVHDVAYLRNPAFYADRRTNEYGYRHVLGGSLKRARRVLAISHSTRRDLIEFFGLDPATVWVVPYGADPRFRPLAPEERKEALARLGIDRPYALFPAGTLDARKNVERTIEAFAAAFPDRRERPLLFIAGVGGPSRGALETAGRLGLAGDIRIHQAAYPHELAALMSGALWGMYPSLYEGFGLPPLEAMACGLPMLVSDVSSVPEVAGDAAVLVDPRDADAIAAGMRKLQGDDALREDLRSRGIRRATSPAFSWARTARQTLAAYRDDEAAFSAEPQPLREFPVREPAFS